MKVILASLCFSSILLLTAATSEPIHERYPNRGKGTNLISWLRRRYTPICMCERPCGKVSCDNPEQETRTEYGIRCKTCPKCPVICHLPQCPRCPKFKEGWKQTYDENNCPTRCPECDFSVPGDGDLKPCAHINCLIGKPDCGDREPTRPVMTDQYENQCLGCWTCPSCPEILCFDCVPVDDWEPSIDEYGCITDCAPCKAEEPPFCAANTCPRLPPICKNNQKPEYSIGTDQFGKECRGCLACPSTGEPGEIPSCNIPCNKALPICPKQRIAVPEIIVDQRGKRCKGCLQCPSSGDGSGEIPFCPGKICPAFIPNCPYNRIAVPELITDQYGNVCKGCLKCPDECETVFCPACAAVGGWIQPHDEKGCPVGCPPCRVEEVPKCRPRSCPHIRCPRPALTAGCTPVYQELTFRDEVCLGCPICPAKDQTLGFCPHIDCMDIDCDDPVYPEDDYEGTPCLGCGICRHNYKDCSRSSRYE